MSQESTSATPQKRHIGGDLVIPLLGLVFTVYYFSTIINSPWTAQVSAFFIGTVLLVLIALFAFKSALAVIRGQADLGLQRLTDPVPYMGRRLGLLALTVGFIFFVDYGGFTITTFVFLTLAMLLLSRGRSHKLILVLSAIMAVGGYFLFIWAFETRFHEGPFERLMDMVL